MKKEFDVECLFDGVIVSPYEVEEKQYGNIITPNIDNEVSYQGIVESVGPGRKTQTGDIIPTTVRVGDRVILPKAGFTRFEYKGEEYWVGNENTLLGVIRKEN